MTHLCIGLDYRPASVAPDSGIGRQVRALEQALAARTDCQLLCFSEAPLLHPSRNRLICPRWGSPLDGLQRPTVRWRFEARFLPSALTEQKVGLYIATANMGLPLGRKNAGRRYVLVLHDLFQLTERNFHRSYFKALIYRGIDTVSIAWSAWTADRIWCPSQFSANEATRLFPWARAKIRVLPNLVQAFPKESAQLPTGLPQRFWLAVGTREPRKNMALFVNSWQAARNSALQTPELVLLGHPHDLPEPLRHLPGLHWLTGISDAQLRGVYRAAECLWQPSYAEGFGLPVIEALSQGTPVAVAKGSALDEVAPPDSTRFSAHSPQELTDCMHHLSQHPQPRDQATQFEWAERFDVHAYNTRLGVLIKEFLT